MDLSTYTQELRESLLAAAAVGDEQAQRSAGALVGAIDPAARLVLLHALSDMAAEVTSQLTDTQPDAGEQITVDVRLEGRDVRIGTTRRWSSAAGWTGSTKAPAAEPAGADDNSRAFTDASGDLSRTTVRMFNELKAKAEKAAADQGLSLNSFISRAVADSIRSDVPRRWKERSGHGFHYETSTSSASSKSETSGGGSSISGFVQG